MNKILAIPAAIGIALGIGLFLVAPWFFVIIFFAYFALTEG